MTDASRLKSNESDWSPAITPAADARNERSKQPRAGKLDSKDESKTWFQRQLPNGVDGYTMGWIGLLHVGALAAPFFFSWEAVVVTVLLHWLTGGIGICLGYHRLFTHSSFQTYRPVKWALALIGGLAGQGPATKWVADHRKHHALSDQEGDPHSPHDGGWWSHVWWLARHEKRETVEAHINRWAPDLKKDPVMAFIGAMFIPFQVLLGLAMLGAGYWYGGWVMGLSMVAWGMFARTVFVLHSTWFVNSASHMWGYVNYKTTDDSKNNWWVAVVTYGEGWHNNHHAYPRMANHGHRWWEIDTTYTAIRMMKWCGIAWNVVNYKHKNDVEPRHQKANPKLQQSTAKQAEETVA